MNMSSEWLPCACSAALISRSGSVVPQADSSIRPRLYVCMYVTKCVWSHFSEIAQCFFNPLFCTSFFSSNLPDILPIFGNLALASHSVTAYWIFFIFLSFMCLIFG